MAEASKNTQKAAAMPSGAGAKAKPASTTKPAAAKPAAKAAAKPAATKPVAAKPAAKAAAKPAAAKPAAAKLAAKAAAKPAAAKPVAAKASPAGAAKDAPLDAKERFRLALARKREAAHHGGDARRNTGVVHGSEVAGKMRRTFRRKTG